MRIFLSLTNSAKQCSELVNFLSSYRSRYLNICIVFDLSDQTEISQSQYLDALNNLNKRRTIFIKEKVSSKVHFILKFLLNHTLVVTVILGNILGFYCREYFEMPTKSKKVLLDDGLIVASVSKLLVASNRVTEFQMYSSYTDFLDPRISIITKSRNQTDKRNFDFNLKLEPETLGIFGSPMVESGFLTLNELEVLILLAMKWNGCTEVRYFMHRREVKKFDSTKIHEILSQESDSLKLITESKVIPLKWWSIYSSALVDLTFLGIPELEYSFTAINTIPKMNNQYLAGYGISTVDSIYEIYSRLSFKEIP